MHHRVISLNNVSGVFSTEVQSISTPYITPREEKPLWFSSFSYLNMMKIGVRNPNMCVSIETRLRSGRFRVCIPAGEQGVLQNVCTGCTAHPASYSVGTKVTAGVKRPGLEVNHSSPCSAKFKNEWNYTSIPSHCPHDVDIEGFTFTYYHGCTALQPESRGFDSRWCHLNFSLT